MSTRAKMNRRRFLQGLGVGSTALLVAACAQPTPAPAPESAAKAPEPTKAPAAPAATQPPAATKAPEPTKAPAAKDAVTLTYWVPLNSNVAATLKSFSEMTMYKELEKRLNVKLEFQHPPVGGQQELEAFNLMVASRKYPDIIEWNWLGFPGGPAKAVKDGVILKLNDLIDKSAPNYKKLLSDHPDWRKEVLDDDGELYCFPFLRGDPRLMVFVGPTLRHDWLQKLNLEVPTTLDEWRTVLTQFKTKDPNGNGKNDEAPFTPAWGTGGAYRFAFNNHAFIGAWGITIGFYQEQGTVKYGPMQPEFKEFLATMAAWYKEGLIDPDWVNMDTKLLDAKVTGSILGSWVGYTGSGIGRLAGLMQGKEPASFKLVGGPYPVLKKGDKPVLGQRDRVYPGGASAAITPACKNVSEAIRVLDYGYGPEGHMLYNFGVEGISYTLENGYPKYTDDVVKNPKLPIAQSMARHFRSNFAGPFVQDYRYFEQYLTLPEQIKAVETWSEPTNEKLMPPVTPTQEESKKFSQVMQDVDTRFDEAFTKIVTGQQPVDSWDQVVSQLKQMGIEDALKVQQAALERYAKR